MPSQSDFDALLSAPETTTQSQYEDAANTLDLRGILDIFWSLLPSGGDLWDYKPLVLHDQPFVLIKDRLFDMADKILHLPFTMLDLTFTGAEPLMHPHLLALIRHIVDFGLECKITLECGLSGLKNHIAEEYKGLPAAMLNFHVFLDGALDQPRAYLTEIGRLAERGWKVHVSIKNATSSQDDFLQKAARAMARTAPFTVCDSKADYSRHIAVTPTSQEKLNLATENSFFCGMGVNYLRIDPNGRIFGAPCELELGPCPLWKIGQNIHPALVRCSRSDCVASRKWGTVCFQDIDRAAAWFAKANSSNSALARTTATEPAITNAARQPSSVMANFCRTLEQSALPAEILYEEWRQQLLAELGRASRTGQLAELLKPRIIEQLGKSVEVMRALIGECARLFCERKKIILPLASEKGIYPEQYLGHSSVWQVISSQSSDHPLLTVIIPNYNKKQMLASCVESVLGQSFGNFELLIMDDGSTDGSIEILEDYARRDARIGLWRREYSCLPGSARNFGLHRAKGRFVIFVDSDDLCLPGYFDLALKSILANGSDAVCFASRMIDRNGKNLWTNFPPGGQLSRTQALRAFFDGVLEPAPWAKVFSLDCIRLFSARFAPSVYHQDVPFFFSFLAGSRKIGTDKEVVYENRETCDSAMHPVEATRQRLHSAYAFQKFYHDALQMVFGDYMKIEYETIPLKQAMFNLEAALLPNAGAYIFDGQKVPLTQDEAKMLAQSPVSLLCLLTSLANNLEEADW